MNENNIFDNENNSVENMNVSSDNNENNSIPDDIETEVEIELDPELGNPDLYNTNTNYDNSYNYVNLETNTPSSQEPIKPIPPIVGVPLLA